MNIPGIILVVFLMLILGFLTIQYSLLIPAKKGLPVLMYHKILDGTANALTVTCEQFDLQLRYLKDNGYHTINFRTLKSLMTKGAVLPEKTIILTFDDAYLNFRQNALPLLNSYGFKATVFVPVAFIGKTNIWDHGNDPIMTEADLKQLSNNEDVEIGLHSFLHKNYGDLAIEEMEKDLDICKKTLDFYGIPFVRVLAYP